jgi:hypothetical protein
MRNFSAGAGSSSAMLRGPVATSEPAAEISVKGRDKPVVRNPPDVKPGPSLLEFSNTDTPLQKASISGLPAGGEGLGHLVFGVGGICLAKKALFGGARQKLKKAKARASSAEIGGIQQNASGPKQGETSTDTPKRPRSESSTPYRNGHISKKAQGLQWTREL